MCAVGHPGLDCFGLTQDEANDEKYGLSSPLKYGPSSPLKYGPSSPQC
jgi:hypothetical protein